ncbi:Aste57867_7946 [Aphanomyces stellatus]|uniref:Aste57867_7946 protein n=1 Tax=Aphanomyces stellatus TaxID=120398 RepID=A0A485KJ27_9STRA|nr:hypothetical protein As57867_007916 [Aphanomyces stellatus]VFT84839.1 Aste57867_7946 [Aphanomyces stellatus]
METTLARATQCARATLRRPSATFVDLNVGRTLFTVFRKTLLRVKGSYFDAMLGSDQWIAHADGDVDAAPPPYVLAVDPITFPRVLDALGTGALSFAGLSDWDATQLRATLDSLKLDVRAFRARSWDPRCCSASMELSSDRTMAHAATPGTRSTVLGDTSVASFRVVLDAFDSSTCVGVCARGTFYAGIDAAATAVGYFIRVSNGSVGHRVDAFDSACVRGGFVPLDVLTVTCRDGIVRFQRNDDDDCPAAFALDDVEVELVPVVSTYFNATLTILK